MLEGLKSEKILKNNCFGDFVKAPIIFNESITILDNSGILCHYKNDSLVEISDYKKKNIVPMVGHNGIKKYSYIVQNLEYDNEYIAIIDGNIQKMTLSKLNNKKYGAVLLKEELPTLVDTIYVNKEDLIKSLSKQDNDNVIIINSDGNIENNYISNGNDNNKPLINIPSEEELIINYKKENLKKINNELIKLYGNYSKRDLIKINYLNELKEVYSNMDLNSIISGINLFNKDIIVATYKDGKIDSLNNMFIKLISPNNYKIQSMRSILNNNKNKVLK